MFEHKNSCDYVIIGCGRLGAKLASEFSDQNKDVLIIDKSSESFRKLSPTYGGLTMEADATEIETLRNAGLNENTKLIVVSNNDNVNIMVAELAKYYFNVKEVIARLYDPEHACAYEEFEIRTICPVILSVDQICKEINDSEENNR